MSSNTIVLKLMKEAVVVNKYILNGLVCVVLEYLYLPFDKICGFPTEVNRLTEVQACTLGS